MTLLLLDVKGSSSHFQVGLNVIVVPVSLFTHTQLNTRLQNNDLPTELSENSFYKGHAAEFYGVNRREETVSAHVEGLITKEWVTPSEAEAILTLLLQNETGDIVYAVECCDLVGEVERLGLAYDVLKRIPFDASAYQDGPTGPPPKGFWEWWGWAFVHESDDTVVNAKTYTLYI